jgi:hypothetical protein
MNDTDQDYAITRICPEGFWKNPSPQIGDLGATKLRFTKRLKNLPASLQVTGLEPTLKRKNRPNCQLVYKKNNFSWGDFSGGWQIFLGKSPTVWLGHNRARRSDAPKGAAAKAGKAEDRGQLCNSP